MAGHLYKMGQIKNSGCQTLRTDIWKSEKEMGGYHLGGS